MSFMVYGIAQSKIDKCRERAIQKVQSRKSITRVIDGKKVRTAITPAIANSIIDEMAQVLIAKLKPMRIAQFDHPQFCRDWIELAKKTRAPYASMHVVTSAEIESAKAARPPSKIKAKPLSKASALPKVNVRPQRQALRAV